MKNFILYFFSLILIFSCQTDKTKSIIAEEYCPSSIDPTTFNLNNVNKLVILRNENLPCLIVKIEKDDLKSFDRVDSIPRFISEFVSLISSEGFWLANPNEPWQSGCSPPMEFDTINESPLVEIDKDGNQIRTIRFLDKKYPMKQLIQFSLGKTTAILTYRSGGWAGSNSHILFFEFKKDRVLDFWCYNPDSPSDLLGDVIDYVKAKYDKGSLEHGVDLNL